VSEVLAVDFLSNLALTTNTIEVVMGSIISGLTEATL
jgi:hypothetical protein